MSECQKQTSDLLTFAIFLWASRGNHWIQHKTHNLRKIMYQYSFSVQEPRYAEYRETKMNARIWHCRVFKSFQTITTRMWNLAGRLLYYQTDLKSRAVKFFIPKTWVITACWKSDFFSHIRSQAHSQNQVAEHYIEQRG